MESRDRTEYVGGAKRSKKFIFLLILGAIILAIAIYKIFSGDGYGEGQLNKLMSEPVPDFVNVQLIGFSSGSREGVKLDGVKDIVIHYVGNPGTTAQQNRNYFDGEASNVSSHFVVGLNGEVIQCLPLDEKSAASNWRNNDTISIEVCHPDKTGQFNSATYDSLVKLTKWLCNAADISDSNVIRHYDITGKACPLYFVNNEEAWKQFKQDVHKA
ncbi:MAG: N-acetylmuramoyl-L-alanine amidase [Firmicutes bacterium]|nr:N-acetylmuramoyl-L-alanine amidase [Bacillota bacterium]